MSSISALKSPFWPRALILWALGLTLAWLATSPAQALIQPRAWDWLARLNRILPPEARQICQERASALPLNTKVEELLAQAASLGLDLPQPTLQFYLGLRLLVRQDRALEARADRLERNRQGQSILRAYRSRLQRRLNHAAPSPTTSPWVLPQPHPEYIELKEGPQGIEVLRPLPEGEIWNREHLRLCLEAAAQDLATLEEQERQLERQQEEQRAVTTPLRHWVRHMGRSLDPRTGLPLANPPQRGDNSLELLLPPPPVDLPQLKPGPGT